MSGADWGFLAYLILLGALLGWLEIRYLGRRAGNPEEETKWPEWWTGEPSAPKKAAGSVAPAAGPARPRPYPLGR
jgi:hypothetical protein